MRTRGVTLCLCFAGLNLLMAAVLIADGYAGFAFFNGFAAGWCASAGLLTGDAP